MVISNLSGVKTASSGVDFSEGETFREVVKMKVFRLLARFLRTETAVRHSFTFIIIFRHINNMEGKSSTQSERFLYVHLPTVRTECSDSEFGNVLPPNHNKFAAKCSKCTFWFFEKDWFFEKKLGIFSKSVKVANLL